MNDKIEQEEYQRWLINRLYEQNKEFIAYNFEKELGVVIDKYVKEGLVKKDLVRIMEWVTNNCKLS